jgi:hypothetical protein
MILMHQLMIQGMDHVLDTRQGKTMEAQAMK